MSGGTPDLAAAIIRALDDDALDALADRLAPRLTQRIERTTGGEPDRWLDTRQAAAGYAGCGLSTLQRAAAAGEIESSQRCQGGRRWFRAAWIDDWREGRPPSRGGSYAGRDASTALPSQRGRAT